MSLFKALPDPLLFLLKFDGYDESFTGCASTTSDRTSCASGPSHTVFSDMQLSSYVEAIEVTPTLIVVKEASTLSLAVETLLTLSGHHGGFNAISMTIVEALTPIPTVL